MPSPAHGTSHCGDDAPGTRRVRSWSRAAPSRPEPRPRNDRTVLPVDLVLEPRPVVPARCPSRLLPGRSRPLRTQPLPSRWKAASTFNDTSSCSGASVASASVVPTTAALAITFRIRSRRPESRSDRDVAAHLAHVPSDLPQLSWREAGTLPSRIPQMLGRTRGVHAGASCRDRKATSTSICLVTPQPGESFWYPGQADRRLRREALAVLRRFTIRSDDALRRAGFPPAERGGRLHPASDDRLLVERVHLLRHVPREALPRAGARRERWPTSGSPGRFTGTRSTRSSSPTGDALGMDLSRGKRCLDACKAAFPKLRRVSRLRDGHQPASRKRPMS
jgi:hypothetical protein